MACARRTKLLKEQEKRTLKRKLVLDAMVPHRQTDSNRNVPTNVVGDFRELDLPSCCLVKKRRDCFRTFCREGQVSTTELCCKKSLLDSARVIIGSDSSILVRYTVNRLSRVGLLNVRESVRQRGSLVIWTHHFEIDFAGLVGRNSGSDKSWCDRDHRGCYASHRHLGTRFEVFPGDRNERASRRRCRRSGYWSLSNFRYIHVHPDDLSELAEIKGLA